MSYAFRFMLFVAAMYWVFMNTHWVVGAVLIWLALELEYARFKFFLEIEKCKEDS